MCGSGFELSEGFYLVSFNALATLAMLGLQQCLSRWTAQCTSDEVTAPVCQPSPQQTLGKIAVLARLAQLEQDLPEAALWLMNRSDSCQRVCSRCSASGISYRALAVVLACSTAGYRWNDVE